MGEILQNDGSFVRFEVRKYKRDCLRMLLLNEVEEVSRIRASDKIEWPDLEARSKPVYDVDGLLAAKRLFQELTGKIDTAGGNELVRHHEFLELLQDGIFGFRVYCFKPGNLEGKGFNFIFPQIFEYFRGYFRTYGNKENSGLLPAGLFFGAFFLSSPGSSGGLGSCSFCHRLFLQ
jgi:hypothetical protein